MQKKTAAQRTSGLSYVGTLAAARTMGMSIGSVQRMMDNGILEGHLTPGGHRRVSVSSIHRYIQKTGMTAQTPQTNPANPTRQGSMALFTDNPELIAHLASAKDLPSIVIIRSPVDLLYLRQEPSVSFMDYEWLQKHQKGDEDMAKIQNLQALVFNAPAHLAANTGRLHLLTDPLNADFIRGYLFCAQQPSLAHP